MPPEIFMSIIGALYLLLVAVLSYIWVSSERRNEKRLAEINERIEFISNSFTESLDKVYSEIRKVV
ncbi:MAG TPA: hypothetical protein DF383_05000, partial [Deltaproteobacteria bacterium]|nr:hypothetical protein [Deltaproteobacteria bacterium]